MRTKTLLLTAALSAASLGTSMAQVFSVNAVGYVVTKVPARSFVLISNPLTAQDNKISALFAGAAPGTQVFKFNPATGSFSTATFDDIDNAFLPADAAAQEVKPGEGVFVFNPSAAEISFTFVGEVPQGDLKNDLPKGLSIKSSMVPQAGTVVELGFPGGAGDQIFKFNVATQQYATSTFDDIDNAWLPAVPSIGVGEAFFLNKATAGSWNRTFTVNP